MPEASIAKELELRYISLCPVVNYAAGRGDSKDGLSHEIIMKNSDQLMSKLLTFVLEFIRLHGD